MGKRLVAYFSASKGKVTEHLAKELAEASCADIFEIKPEVPYTEADINWVNPLSRCNKEKFGKKDVPVEGKVGNMEEYDLIMIGFPIWYGCAPNVVNTFLKDYDLSGKKIAVFATSGGSGIGKTADKLKPYISDTTEIVTAERMSGSESREALKAWADRCDENK
jgi:flavodoxin